MATLSEMNELDEMLDNSKLSSGKENNATATTGAGAGATGAGGDDPANPRFEVTNRSEKKARKSLSKLGLVKVQGINRVTFRRPKGVRFISLSLRLSLLTLTYAVCVDPVDHQHARSVQIARLESVHRLWRRPARGPIPPNDGRSAAATTATASRSSCSPRRSRSSCYSRRQVVIRQAKGRPSAGGR